MSLHLNRSPIRVNMRRILVFLEFFIHTWALIGDIFLAEHVQQAKLENQKLLERIHQKLQQNDIQQLLKNLTDEETERFHRENEVNLSIISAVFSGGELSSEFCLNFSKGEIGLLQVAIRNQTAKVETANKLIRDIRSKKSAIHVQINQAEEDLQNVLDDVKRKLKISIYIENSKLLGEVVEIRNQLKMENIKAGLLSIKYLNIL